MIGRNHLKQYFSLVLFHGTPLVLSQVRVRAVAFSLSLLGCRLF